MRTDDWQYDVFISYSPADRRWVWEWLLHRLKTEGIRVITDRETFDVAVPRINNLEYAVAASRHVILVLSPDWVRDDWYQLEVLLFQSQDPIGLRSRILPLLHRPCELPQRLATLTPADLTGDDVEEQFHRL